VNSLRLDDETARHFEPLRFLIKECYANEVRKYFLNLNLEVDWSSFLLAQMQVLLDTVNAKGFNKDDTFTVFNAIFFSNTNANIELEIAGLELKANAGSLSALIHLADLYERGVKVEKDISRAIGYLKRAVELNSTVAMNHLGLIYLDGIDVNKDLKKAFSLFKSSATLGDKLGQYNIGIFYLKYALSDITDNFFEDEFIELQKNVATKVWITLAAEQGLANAQHDLGCAYHIDESFGIDYKLAHFWYQLAAAQGFLDSINNLGELYLNGYGVEKDLVTAYKYFHIASVDKSSDALDSLSDLEKILSAEEIEDALLRKKNWLSMHPIANLRIYDKT